MSSVGFTALMVTAGRAVETHRENGLVDDRWSEQFVDTAGTVPRLPSRPEQSWPLSGESTLNGDVKQLWQRLSAYQGLRSHYFDAELIRDTGQGIDQVVLLAAGLDTRAFRLPWASGVRVYEVDQPAVLGFKDEVLRAHGVRPQCVRCRVDADLREDWGSSLQTAGFTPGRRSVWLLEGLLAFLPAQAEADLFAAIDRLAPAGSSVVVEHFAPAFEALAPTHPGLSTALTAPFGVDFAKLPSNEPRTDPARRLAHTGWTVTSTSATQAANAYHRPLPKLSSGLSIDNTLITATK